MGRSIVSPPSACLGCGQPVAWYDNIPVVSWLILRGRCRTCRIRIPLRYVLLELGVGLTFGATALFTRPLAVPLLLTIAVGAIVNASTWLMHRRFSGRVAIVSAALVVVVSAVTVGVWQLR